jgi:hypothetical protein
MQDLLGVAERRVIFIVLIFIKISPKLGDTGKTKHVKFAFETLMYMFVFKNSSAEQNQKFEFGYFYLKSL